jgi:hypothetical protein
MRRDVMDIHEMVRNKGRPHNTAREMPSGSHREGLRMRGSDLDYALVSPTTSDLGVNSETALQ